MRGTGGKRRTPSSAQGRGGRIEKPSLKKLRISTFRGSTGAERAGQPLIPKERYPKVKPVCMTKWLDLSGISKAKGTRGSLGTHVGWVDLGQEKGGRGSGRIRLGSWKWDNARLS